MDGGDGGAKMRVCLMPLNVHLKNGEDGTFYVLCILPQHLVITYNGRECKKKNTYVYIYV